MIVIDKLGKNARKRAARRAFACDENPQGKIPFALHVVEWRDGKPRNITFASLTSYKEYRARFYGVTGQTGKLVLVSDLATLDDSKGKTNRTRVINKGIGINTGKETKPSYLASRPKSRAVDGYRTTPQETFATVQHDIARQEAIKSETVRVARPKGELKAIREKFAVLKK